MSAKKKKVARNPRKGVKTSSSEVGRSIPQVVSMPSRVSDTENLREETNQILIAAKRSLGMRLLILRVRLLLSSRRLEEDFDNGNPTEINPFFGGNGPFLFEAEREEYDEQDIDHPPLNRLVRTYTYHYTLGYHWTTDDRGMHMVMTVDADKTPRLTLPYEHFSVAADDEGWKAIISCLKKNHILFF